MTNPIVWHDLPRTDTEDAIAAGDGPHRLMGAVQVAPHPHTGELYYHRARCACGHDEEGVDRDLVVQRLARHITDETDQPVRLSITVRHDVVALADGYPADNIVGALTEPRRAFPGGPFPGVQVRPDGYLYRTRPGQVLAVTEGEPAPVGAWVIERGDCNYGDHETVEVFFGTEVEADARAAAISPDAMVMALPLTGAVPHGVTTTAPRPEDTPR